MKTYIDLRIDCDGQVLSFDHSVRLPGKIRRQLDNLDSIMRLMGWDASAELLYFYTMEGCAMRDVVLEQFSPPIAARCSLLKSANRHEILCRLAFADSGLQ
ncbi:hypothetical protein [Paramagnetospirillum magneticum]|uniref:hypothetical protein n=1 Tax=Paramagnetospirillum magneticum TaxID=84159 RepID=UPI0005C180FC|nr:hypothetical protein [Paramagnetospirillum magneticum]